jgi:2-polyprenyl-6-methoxyphenol hydroxylase-like FAD-dependent oxidoreductase
MDEIEVPVLIVGGSLVGMSMAALLGHHGIPSFTAEYHRGTAIHPRAAQTSQRSMEVFRQLGVEDAVMKRSEEQFVQDGGVLAVETLVGGVTENYIANLNAGVRETSPSLRTFLSQTALEPILKERAESLGARFRFATEVVSFEQDATGVRATLRDRDSGETSTVRAKYLVAADGAHSRVREALGIRMLGHGTFSNSVTIYFRANLKPLVEGKPWAVVYANNDKLRGFFRFEKPFDNAFLVVNTVGDPAKPDSDVSTGIDDERARDLVHTALGTRDIPVKIESMMKWKATSDYAEHFQSGRVFIAGDAAHVMPPNGGFGGNTGIQDAHNLAWKLALVLKGKSRPELLDTYEPERRPVGELTIRQAYTRYVVRTNPTLSRVGTQAPVHELNIETGYIYRSAAIISEDAADERVHEHPNESKGRPGTRAPHMWLDRGGQRISTLDLYGQDFVLLTGPARNSWRDAARAAANATGIALDCKQVEAAGLTDPSGTFAAAHGIGPTGCVLVRPDGFVAWRASEDSEALQDRLQAVFAQITCSRG